jgi:hypothetical protein
LCFATAARTALWTSGSTMRSSGKVTPEQRQALVSGMAAFVADAGRSRDTGPNPARIRRS